MATIHIEGDRLVVRLSGWQAVWALKREINVPLDNVASASAGTVTTKRPSGIRAPGTYLPNVITAGSYWQRGAGWSFWSVRDESKAVDIRLRDSRYVRLVIEVDDPYATATMIDAAIQPGG